MGAGGHWPDRLTRDVGLWPAKLPSQSWRLITTDLVNPAFATRTVRLSLFDHWAINITLVVAAGRRVERRFGAWTMIAACVAGALAAGVWLWSTFPAAGPSGGTSGASFGVLGAVIVLGLLSGGVWRRRAGMALLVTLAVLSWMYDRYGVLFHVIALAGGGMLLAAVTAAG